MRRASSAWLSTWLDSDLRNPLIIRGARQAGKTWLVRDIVLGKSLVMVAGWRALPGSSRRGDLLVRTVRDGRRNARGR